MELVEVIAAVVLVGLALEPAGHVLTDLAACWEAYEGWTIISLRSRRTSVFLGMDLRAENSRTGSSGLVLGVVKWGAGWWVMMLEGRGL